MNNYNVVETTNMYGSKCLSFQATSDIENGMLVAKGDLVTGETDIYTASVPTTSDEVYLVANPAWSYDNNRATDQNEENYINKAGVPFRVYQLKKDNKFKIYSTAITPTTTTKDSQTVDVPVAVGQYITVDGTTNKPKAVATKPTSGFVGKVIAVEEIGFPYCVGSLGQNVVIGSGDTAVTMGYSVDTRVTKVTIEVIKNV